MAEEIIQTHSHAPIIVATAATSLIWILILGGLWAGEIFETDDGEDSDLMVNVDTNNPDDAPYDHPLLSPAQEQALTTVGVDLRTLPTSITPEMEGCVSGKLGAERVAQIKGSSRVTFDDFNKAKECFK